MLGGRAHHRQAGGHRFDDDQAERLEPGGHRGDRGPAPLLVEGGDRAHELDAALEAVPGDELQELLAAGAAAVDPHGPVGEAVGDLGEGRDEDVEALHAGQAAGGHDDRLGQVGGRQGAAGDRVGDAHDLVGGRGEGFAVALRVGLGDGDHGVELAVLGEDAGEHRRLVGVEVHVLLGDLDRAGPAVAGDVEVEAHLRRDQDVGVEPAQEPLDPLVEEQRGLPHVVDLVRVEERGAAPAVAVQQRELLAAVLGFADVPEVDDPDAGVDGEVRPLLVAHARGDGDLVPEADEGLGGVQGRLDGAADTPDIADEKRDSHTPVTHSRDIANYSIKNDRCPGSNAGAPPPNARETPRRPRAEKSPPKPLIRASEAKWLHSAEKRDVASDTVMGEP